MIHILMAKFFFLKKNDYFLTCYFSNENRMKLLCLEALNLDKCKQKFPFLQIYTFTNALDTFSCKSFFFFINKLNIKRR